MVYCIADIHGEIDRYKSMLDLIQFSEDDTLYVLGDVIDRNPGGVNILEDIMTRKNVILLLGNHELMALATLGPHVVLGARDLWRENGGTETRRELLYLRTREEREDILRFIQSLPDHLDIEVNGCKFHLVHGMPGNDTGSRVWDRPEVGAPAPIPGTTVIVGHTPTVYLNGDNGEPFRIWHGDGIICIDCGCGNTTELRRLACLRLDDMEEFYI